MIIGLVIIGPSTETAGQPQEEPKDEPKSTEEDQQKAAAEEEQKVKEKASAEAETKKKSEKGTLTKEKFEQIKDGMTYEEVISIIGSEGTLLSEAGDKGTQFHTVIYEFETDGIFSSSTMMFQGGKLINKAQLGLDSSSDVKITLEQFNEIQNGMTFEEVTSIFGGEGSVISESGQKGTNLHTVVYSYEGKGSLGANVSLMFQGNKLTNKAQFGLK